MYSWVHFTKVVVGASRPSLQDHTTTERTKKEILQASSIAREEQSQPMNPTPCNQGQTNMVPDTALITRFSIVSATVQSE